VLDTESTRISRFGRVAGLLQQQPLHALSAQDSLVSAANAVRLPRAVNYGRVTLSMFGGASRSKPGSYAYVKFFSRRKHWGSSLRVNPGLGRHSLGRKDGSAYAFDDRYFVWGVYTFDGFRYDVKSYSLEVPYQVLVPETA